MTQAHNPACENRLETEGAWCLRWADIPEASGEDARVERSEKVGEVNLEEEAL